MRVYRYDALRPLGVSTLGFGGYAACCSGRRTMLRPMLMLFDDATIFAAASRAGADDFLAHDMNVFRLPGYGVARGHSAAHRMAAAVPFLHRLKVDTHRAISFRDMLQKFGLNFAVLVCNCGRMRPLTPGDSSVRAPSRGQRHALYFMRDQLQCGYHDNDEVHVAGPLNVLPPGRTIACGDISLVSFEWLDLAVDM